MWCDGGDFQSWSSALSQHVTYVRGENTVIGGFAAAGATTFRTITLITALLFANSGLTSTLLEFGDDYTVDGTEDVGGHRCHKLVGIARSLYAKTQRITNARRTTIWIDTESLLVRKVFEDTPDGSPQTAVIRTTVTLDPRPNPTLEDARFTYTVPSPSR
jgi:outer membrane lipoprotein-sorting protein